MVLNRDAEAGGETCGQHVPSGCIRPRLAAELAASYRELDELEYDAATGPVTSAFDVLSVLHVETLSLRFGRRKKCGMSDKTFRKHWDNCGLLHYAERRTKMLEMPAYCW